MFVTIDDRLPSQLPISPNISPTEHIVPEKSLEILLWRPEVATVRGGQSLQHLIDHREAIFGRR